MNRGGGSVSVLGDTEEVQVELEVGCSSGSDRAGAVVEEVVKNEEMEDHLMRDLFRNSGGKKPGKKVIFNKREIQCTRDPDLLPPGIKLQKGR
jgi:hypothetical protein